MEFKGTKGKWYVSQPNGKSICAEADNALGYEVVVVQDGFNSKYDQKAKANALIASKAPEMLEFLIKLKKEWEEDDLRYGGENFHMEEITNLIKEATEI